MHVHTYFTYTYTERETRYTCVHIYILIANTNSSVDTSINAQAILITTYSEVDTTLPNAAGAMVPSLVAACRAVLYQND